MDEFYPKPFTGIESLSQKIYSLGKFQARVAEKLEEDLHRPPRLVEEWISFFSAEIKEILAMEQRLYDDNSVESLGLLQSVIQQLKTMKKYIADQMDPTHVDSDLVSELTQKSSISSAESEDESKDESLDCRFLPPFCFKEDVDPLNGVSLQPEDISKSVINDFNRANCVKFFSETLANVECLNDLFFLHTKILGIACSHFKLDDSRLLFDRGKFASKLIFQLLLSLGYDSELRVLDSITLLCVKSVDIHGMRKVFVQMLERVNLSVVGENFIWQLKMGKAFDRDKDDILLQLKQGVSRSASGSSSSSCM
ncbi:uncharacterized protein LOC113358256 [Papaver somniferum]|uniref:uncharacterized protein LOC113358256 n=1 Tax=Papaver somniferum TaxID=3469 RepID=UPI000E6F5F77|nr:uncharacterized protein LOC113358256 [Papaver somniferum]